MKYILIVDRLSRRHNWNVVGYAKAGDPRVGLLTNWLKKHYLGWSGNLSYPKYQIGNVESDSCDLDSLPKNYDVDIKWDAVQ